MDICPVCDAPFGCDIETILGRVTDIELLQAVACDVAQHVSFLTPHSMQTDDLLRRARQGDYEELVETLSDLQDMQRDVESSPARSRRAEKALKSVQSAVKALLSETVKEACEETDRAARAARLAARLSDTWQEENAWQIDMICAACCTCHALPKAAPTGDRLRVSMLAS